MSWMSLLGRLVVMTEMDLALQELDVADNLVVAEAAEVLPHAH